MIRYARLCCIIDASQDLASPFWEELLFKHKLISAFILWAIRTKPQLYVKLFSQTKFLSFIKVAIQTSSREKKFNGNFQHLTSYVSLQFLQIVLDF